MKRKLIAGLMTTAMFASLMAGCSKVPEAAAANAGQIDFTLIGADKSDVSKTADYEKAYSEFLFGLVNRVAAKEDGNFMISPDSVFFALSMTAAGANGTTLEQMTSTMVPGTTSEEALNFAAAHLNSLQNDNLKIANSIWFNKDLCGDLNSGYKDFVISKFNSGIDTFKTPDQAITAINNWTSEHTAGRIPEIVDGENVNDLTYSVLVNAVCFDGTWKDEFTPDMIRDDEFTNKDGSTSKVKILSGTENIYISDSETVGFVKPYADGKFAFMAILPKDKDTDINEFMSKMTADQYRGLWNTQRNTDVKIGLPEFTNEYSIDLPLILTDMGMTDAFSSTKADFTGMTEAGVGLFIDDVIHKTYISVDRKGTEAAAATAVTTRVLGIAPDATPTVWLDRPFAYAVVDIESGLPVFIGTVNEF